MKRFFYLLPAATLFLCSFKTSNSGRLMLAEGMIEYMHGCVYSVTADILMKPGKNSASVKTDYQVYLSTFLKKKAELARTKNVSGNYSDSTIQKAGKLLFDGLTKDVFPYWYGTQWDFNGISNTPGEGYIACGYFVSTTLKHTGSSLNRYKIAQQEAAKITKLLCGESNVKTYRSQEKLKTFLLNNPDGLYIVGLSNHVGFIEKRGSSLFFTHSSYYADVAVMREFFDYATGITYSDVYVVGNLTNNAHFLTKWLNNSFFKI